MCAQHVVTKMKEKTYYAGHKTYPRKKPVFDRESRNTTKRWCGEEKTAKPLVRIIKNIRQPAQASTRALELLSVFFCHQCEGIRS